MRALTLEESALVSLRFARQDAFDLIPFKALPHGAKARVLHYQATDFWKKRGVVADAILKTFGRTAQSEKDDLLLAADGVSSGGIFHQGFRKSLFGFLRCHSVPPLLIV